MHELIYGLHSVEAILQKQPWRIYTLYVMKGRHDDRIQTLVELAATQSVPIEYCGKPQFEKMTGDVNHQGIAVKCQAAKMFQEGDIPELIGSLSNVFILILDEVQDPHNLGACLRTADAAGVNFVIIPKDRSAKLTPVVRKVACGAAETIPLVQVTNLARCCRELKKLGIWLYGTEMNVEQSIYECDFKGPTAIIMGNEGVGLRHLTKEHCDVLMHIPMYGTVASLNVSVATSICLYEAVRQRHHSS